MIDLGILDYGVGNLFSLKTAFERCGAHVTLHKEISSKDELDGIILPGVGSFTTASRKLKSSRQGLLDKLRGGTPILGICLGMQLFFEKSEEGSGKGLTFMKGDVIKLANSVKVPHMGWDTIQINKDNEFLDNIQDNSWVYFVHSYYPNPIDEKVRVAETRYGVMFPSVVAEKNLYGTQFHPEKSGKTGSKIIENFLSICR